MAAMSALSFPGCMVLLHLRVLSTGFLLVSLTHRWAWGTPQKGRCAHWEKSSLRCLVPQHTHTQKKTQILDFLEAANLQQGLFFLHSLEVMLFLPEASVGSGVLSHTPFHLLGSDSSNVSVFFSFSPPRPLPNMNETVGSHLSSGAPTPTKR